MTYEEAKEHSRRAVKDHFKPRSPEKRVPIDVEPATKFLTNLKFRRNGKRKLPSDYDRTLIKAHQKMRQSGKGLPQLGTQQKNLESLRVTAHKEQHAAQFLEEMGFYPWAGNGAR
jgi:hypothetical protein